MKIEVDSDILFYAFRYTLGRMTCAVSDVVGAISEYVTVLDEVDLRTMLREISKAISEGRAGMGMDVREWAALKDLISTELGKR
jgi:hypothetical protein